MAGIQATAGAVSAALVASTQRTVVQILAGADSHVLVQGWSVSFSGVVSTDNPVLVTVLRQADAGTSAALTPLRKDAAHAEGLLTSALKTFSAAEPGAGSILYQMYVHPQTGWHVLLPYGQEIHMTEATRLGISVLPGAAPAGTLVCYAQIDFEE